MWGPPSGGPIRLKPDPTCLSCYTTLSRRGAPEANSVMFSSARLPIASRVLERRAAQMRKQHNILHVQQLGRDTRLTLENVEARSSDLPLLQRSHQRCFVHNVAARRVDEDARLLHLAKPLRIHQMTRFGQRGTMQRDEIRLTEHRLERRAWFRAE